MFRSTRYMQKLGGGSVPPTPFAFYDFETGEGNTAIDLINGRNMALVGASWDENTPKGNYAVRSGNNNQYLELSGQLTNLLLANNTFSFALWMNFSGGQFIQIGSANGTRVLWLYQLGGVWRPLIGNSSGGWASTTATSTSPLAGWNHYAFTMSLNEFKVYQNGIHTATKSYNAGNFRKLTQPTYFGGITFNGIQRFDQLYLYDRILTLEEINQLMAA